MNRKSILVVVFVLCTAGGRPASGQEDQPDHGPEPVLVSVSDLDSTIQLDIRYATSHNFAGRRIDGYEAAKCLLSPPAAEALIRVNRDLRQLGYGLVVYDCYRPQRAVDQFVRWSRYPLDQETKEEFYPNVEKAMLFQEGYISSRSGHSRGSTVDVGLVRIRRSAGGSLGRTRVDMGTPFDYFDPRSHTDSPDLAPEQRKHRDFLRGMMRKQGFRNYPKEWWHYTLIGEPYPDHHFDVVIR